CPGRTPPSRSSATRAGCSMLGAFLWRRSPDHARSRELFARECDEWERTEVVREDDRGPQWGCAFEALAASEELGSDMKYVERKMKQAFRAGDTNVGRVLEKLRATCEAGDDFQCRMA